jgi:4-amino-4-deoxy-L-arabinose transferase-like glycosyltransferase
MGPRLDRTFLIVACVALIVAFGLLGSRGIWDPDEGRYTNVALNMLDSGDWVDPRRNDDVGHWTKPPLTYWAIASSVQLFGRNPWAARLPIAFAYLLCVMLTWRLARRLAPGAESVAALVFATMLLPAVASQLITTDFVLTAFEALALAAYVEARFDPTGPRLRWWLVMWAAFGFAFLTKGPPALLPLIAILLFEWLVPSRTPDRGRRFAAFIAFLAVAVPWYAVVSVRHPGLLQHFLGAEVVGRVASDQFRRNGEWYGWATVYLPTFMVGALPWTPTVVRWLRTLPAKVKRWRFRAERLVDREELLLVLWTVVPLAVFCVSRSRLPLYVLPLFVPIALLVARQRQSEPRSFPSLRWIVVTVAGILGLRIAMIFWPTPQNTAEWAAEIQKRSTGPVTEVVFINDVPRYGLKLHLDAEVERVSIASVNGVRFNPPFDDTLANELAEAEPGVVYVTQAKHWPALERSIDALGYQSVLLGEPYRTRIFFTIAAR